MIAPQTAPSASRTKIGSILAIVAGVVALIAFFALPLISAGIFSFTAPQLISLGNSAASSPSSSSSTQVGAANLGLLWLAPLIAVIIIVLGVIPFFVKGGVKPASVPAQFPPYNPNMPPQSTGPYPQQPTMYPPFQQPYQPNVPVSASAGNAAVSRGAGIGNVVLSLIALGFLIYGYVALSSQKSTGLFSAVNPTSFLGMGYWGYLVAMIIALVGGILQINNR